MKLKQLLTFVALTFLATQTYAQFGFNTNGAIPDNSAMVDIVSTTKGLLIPRMTTTQRIEIASPATGLMVFDTILNSFYFYNGTVWTAFSSTSADNLGNHTSTQNINLGNYYLSGTGTDYGLKLDATYGGTLTGSNGSNYLQIGDNSKTFTALRLYNNVKEWTISNYNNKLQFHEENLDIDPFVIDSPTSNNLLYLKGDKVGIGTTSPTEKLEVSGKTKTTTFQMTSNADVGKVLQSDANGNGSWTSISNLETDPQVASTTNNYMPRWNGASLVDGSVYDDGTQTGIGTSTIAVDSRLAIGALNATEGGQFQLNSGSARTVAYFMDNYDDKLRIMSGTNSASTNLHFIMNSSGNVCLGSGSPTEKLDVRGKTKTETFQMTESAINGYILTSDANGNASWASPQNSTSWTISNTNTYNALAGNVGIGTSTPTSKLHVSGNTTLAGQVNFNDNWNIQTGSNLWLEKNGNRFMTIYGTGGYVGIGATAPKSLLEVNGSVGFKISIQSGSTSITLDNTASVWYFSGSASINLPAANTSTNRLYRIVNRSNTARIISTFTNLSGTSTTSLSANSTLEIISDGSNWLQIN
jgi:hypothetical protein